MEHLIMTKSLMEYHFEGKNLSEYDRKNKVKLLMEELLNNMEDHASFIEEALDYLISDMANEDVLRAYDNVFNKKDRR